MYLKYNSIRTWAPWAAKQCSKIASEDNYAGKGPVHVKTNVFAYTNDLFPYQIFSRLGLQDIFKQIRIWHHKCLNRASAVAPADSAAACTASNSRSSHPWPLAMSRPREIVSSAKRRWWARLMLWCAALSSLKQVDTLFQAPTHCLKPNYINARQCILQK